MIVNSTVLAYGFNKQQNIEGIFAVRHRWESIADDYSPSINDILFTLNFQRMESDTMIVYEYFGSKNSIPSHLINQFVRNIDGWSAYPDGQISQES